MYERSAIVLERYFNSILGYSSENNLKVNFKNYCSLVEKLAKFEQCFKQELFAIQEIEDVTERLKEIQRTQEKLYKKSAKLEYNRNILFNNIDEKPEETEFCMIKIENDVEKNKEAFKNLRIDFINTLNEFNEKNRILVKSKKEKRESEKQYRDSYSVTEENIDNINEFILEFARNFNGEEIKVKAEKLMIDNGKEEKIPFDENVISLAVDLGMDIVQKEAQCYIDIYDNTLKLFEEIENNDVKIEKFQRRLKNIKVKLNFLYAEKEYLIQFLDYERMTSVNGKRIHKKLMIQACENFRLDIEQINNLYELILKEIANKATKKAYKELYNKSYLIDINKQDEDFKKEKNKLNLNVGTVLGSNYWRIEGIKNIYTVFYNDISEVFGKSVDEFDVPDEEDVEIELLEDVEPEEFLPKVKPIKKETISKKATVKKIKEEILEDYDLPKLVIEDDEIDEPEKEEIVIEAKVRKSVKSRAKNIEVIEKIEEEPEEIEEIEKESVKENISIIEEKEEESIFEEELEYEFEDEEESLFGNIKKSKTKQKKDFDLVLEELEERNAKKGIFQSIVKANLKKGKRAAN